MKKRSKKARWQLQDVANAIPVSYTTAQRYVAQLVKKKKFKRSAFGKFFNESDMQQLSKLLSFPFDPKKNYNGKSS